jgi:tRNA A37 threonylcarbamoyladenosine dehydratase
MVSIDWQSVIAVVSIVTAIGGLGTLIVQSLIRTELERFRLALDGHFEEKCLATERHKEINRRITALETRRQ